VVVIFNLISKALLLVFGWNCLVVYGIVQLHFTIHPGWFSVLILVNIWMHSVYIGYRSYKRPEIAGFFVGTGSTVILLLFLIQFVKLDLEVSLIMAGIASLVGFFGAWIGSKFDVAKWAQTKKTNKSS
jgi:hypothetical protein